MPATIPEPKLDTIFLPSADEFEAQVEAIRAAQPRLKELHALSEPEDRIALMKKMPLALLLDLACQQREEYRLRSKLADTANQLFKEIEWQALLRFEDMGSEENPLIRAGGLWGPGPGPKKPRKREARIWGRPRKKGGKKRT